MAFDGITIKSIVNELKDKLEGGRIDKIQQPEKDEIILALRCKGVNHKLLLTTSANSPRLHLTARSKPSPAAAPMFCMLLRKHLGGGRIVKIDQPGYERIVDLHIESPNEMGDISTKRLIIEIMGKHSNIILINAENEILGCIRNVPKELSSVREVLPGCPYIRPPSRSKVAPVPFDAGYFAGLLTDGTKNIQQIMYNSYNGISPIMGSEICIRADIEPDARPEILTDAQKENLQKAFISIYEEVESNKLCLRIYEQENGKKDLAVLEMSVYGHLEKSEIYESPSHLTESYYQTQDTAWRMTQKTADLRKLLNTYMERCRRKEQVYEQTLIEIEDREQLRRFGELLTAYIHTVKKGADRVKLADFYNDNEETEIPLDPMLSPAENAQAFFKGYNKGKRTFIALQEQMKANSGEIAYLDSVLSCLSTAADEADIEEIRSELAGEGFIKKKRSKNKTQKKSKPLRYISSDGFEIYVGKNNLQNDELTLRFARATDIWMHTKDIAGSHVIIRRQGKEIPPATISEAAKLAAFHSKGRQSSQVPVDYTEKKNVRKPNGAKPGFVIYDFYNTMYVTPKEEELLAINRNVINS